MAEQITSSGYYQNHYKFNGKELDNETGMYYYGARYYEPRLSVWMSVDPMAEKYPNMSPFGYCANNPVNAIDPDGRVLIYVAGSNSYQYSKGNFWLMKYDSKGNLTKTNIRYNPSKESVSKTMYRVLASYRRIEASKDQKLKGILNKLETTENKHYIYENSTGDNFVHATHERLYDAKSQRMVDGKLLYTQTSFDLNEEGGKDFERIGKSDITTIVHEMRHQYDYEIGNMSDDSDMNNENDPSEIRAVYLENRARDIEKLKHRTTYGGKINPNKLKNPSNNKMPE
jgi:RHS repeat-associated protein